MTAGMSIPNEYVKPLPSFIDILFHAALQKLKKLVFESLFHACSCWFHKNPKAGSPWPVMHMVKLDSCLLIQLVSCLIKKILDPDKKNM